ncbi:MAG TPA: primosomal protein N' [Beutenbergiaceae bacterium]|nr:primosomal protein N' [Beutenbergiaceae bacterium]
MSTDQPALLQVDGARPPEAPDHRLVAEVLVQTPLAHLDRTFDYAVPEALVPSTRPGVRVKVRFAGTERDGFVVATRAPRAGERPLIQLRRVVSEVPALTHEILTLCRSVARYYAGTLSDVLRLAVPPRHAAAERAALQRADRTEEERSERAEGERPEGTEGHRAERPEEHGAERTGRAGQHQTHDDARREAGAPTGRYDWTQEQPPTWPPIGSLPREQDWAPYPGGAAFLRRLASGDHPRAVWTALPWAPAHAEGEARPQDPHWAVAITQAIIATCNSGRSVLTVVPDERDVQTLSAALRHAGVLHEVLSADQGRSARYRRFILALTGQVQVVIGTRSAAFAPVPRLGLVICWDEGDDSLAELRKPYPHARTVLIQRADLSGAGALIGGFARSPQAQVLVRDGWAKSLHADRAMVRRAAPRVQAPGEADLEAEGPAGRARIPSLAWRVLRHALHSGPALVHVPRAGYLPATSCGRCRTPARCANCHGPLRLAHPDAVPACGWCGRLATNWTCQECGHNRLRATRVGSSRTAEELGRAFPGVPVLVSGRDGGVVGAVDARPRLVVSTPGAEPSAEGGYHAAALLDAAVTTERPELDAAVEALRRWMRAAALVRPAPTGQVVLLGQGAPVPTQAMVRWDPIGLAERELDERAELSFPPHVHMAAVEGGAEAVRSFLRILNVPPQVEVLGPVDVPAASVPVFDDDQAGATRTAGERSVSGQTPLAAEVPIHSEPTVRALIRAPRQLATEVNTALTHAQALRSARKEPGAVRVQVDPARLW